MMIYETVVFQREMSIAAAERHHRDIKRYFSTRPDDLLEMNIIAGEGWDKLCPFLGVPLPSVPFPHLHRRSAGS
jgi:Sulfotransferase domain